MKKELEEQLKRLSNSQNLQFVPTKEEDPFSWELAGQQKGREIRVNHLRIGSFLTKKVDRTDLFFVNVPANLPKSFRAIIGIDKRTWGHPHFTFKHIRRKKKGLAGGNHVYAWYNSSFDAEAISSMSISQLLVEPNTLDFEIVVEDGFVRFGYNRRPESLNVDPGFVSRAIQATIELAEWMEGQNISDAAREMTTGHRKGKTDKATKQGYVFAILMIAFMLLLIAAIFYYYL
ncbi:MAG: hypothetical protein PVJ69_10330 [Desulfobacteraceae bacterium]|jgi:hypothetical protein